MLHIFQLYTSNPMMSSLCTHIKNQAFYVQEVFAVASVAARILRGVLAEDERELGYAMNDRDFFGSDDDVANASGGTFPPWTLYALGPNIGALIITYTIYLGFLSVGIV